MPMKSLRSSKRSFFQFHEKPTFSRSGTCFTTNTTIKSLSASSSYNIQILFNFNTTGMMGKTLSLKLFSLFWESSSYLCQNMTHPFMNMKYYSVLAEHSQSPTFTNTQRQLWMWTPLHCSQAIFVELWEKKEIDVHWQTKFWMFKILYTLT